MEGRPVTKLVEEIGGKEMQKETEVERLAGRSVEGRNNFAEEVEGSGGFLHKPLSIREDVLRKSRCFLFCFNSWISMPWPSKDENEHQEGRRILSF